MLIEKSFLSGLDAQVTPHRSLSHSGHKILVGTLWADACRRRVSEFHEFRQLSESYRIYIRNAWPLQSDWVSYFHFQTPTALLIWRNNKNKVRRCSFFTKPSRS